MEINVSKNTDETEHRHTRTSQTRTRGRPSRQWRAAGQADGTTEGPRLLPAAGSGAAGLAASCWTRSAAATLYLCDAQKPCQAPPAPRPFFLQMPSATALRLRNRARARETQCPICPVLVPQRVPEAPGGRGKLCSLLHPCSSVRRE